MLVSDRSYYMIIVMTRLSVTTQRTFFCSATLCMLYMSMALSLLFKYSWNPFLKCNTCGICVIMNRYYNRFKVWALMRNNLWINSRCSSS